MTTGPRRLLRAAACCAVVVATLTAAPALASNQTGGSAGSPAQKQSSPESSPESSRAAATPASVVVPGRLSGLGFDTCTAPDQATMDVLRTQSPYWGVGVYLGGAERTCAQPELTRTWVREQSSRGWHLFPIWVGRQSLCSDAAFRTHISAHNKRAARQGVQAADAAVVAARHLGIAKRSTLFLDVEGYDNTTSACNQPVLHYQSGWNKRLRSLGWKGGLYGAASSTIASIDYIRTTFPHSYVLPAAIWISHADGRPTTRSPYVHNSYWAGQRLKQYRIDTSRTFGPVTLTLDENVIEIGGGSVAPPQRHDCHGVRLSFARYAPFGRGHVGAQVRAAQCLLKQRGLYHSALNGRFDAATAHGVRQFQKRRGLHTTGRVDARTWTALLSAGATPLSKRGSASDPVRALQRALTAALDRPVDVSGAFTASTTAAVRAYQNNVGLDVTGVAGPAVWHALQSGSR